MEKASPYLAIQILIGIALYYLAASSSVGILGGIIFSLILGGLLISIISTIVFIILKENNITKVSFLSFYFWIILTIFIVSFILFDFITQA